MDATCKPTQTQQLRLFTELGLCLYTYQAIELRLKVLVPHLLVPGTDPDAVAQAIHDWRVLLDSKETLGALTRRLAERVTSDDKALWESSWRDLVNQRNEVVHHFVSKPFAKFDSETDFRAAIAFLKQRRQFATLFLDALQKVGEVFVSLLGSDEEGNPIE